MTKGIDYAWAHPSITGLQREGYQFVCRYISHDSTKDLTATEMEMLFNAGISIVMIFESTKNRMLDGYTAGINDATYANERVITLGMTGIPIYFACDFDAAPVDQIQINSYLAGVASIIGINRTGIYGGFWPVSRAISDGSVKWAWQTFAWSGNNWDTRIHIRQIENDVFVGGADVDIDESMTSDFGQWPRPGGTTVMVTVMMALIQEGNTGNAVKLLQDALNIHGTTTQLTPDGVFGPLTVMAVKSFQATHNLVTDGIVGMKTWTAALTV